MYMPPLVHNQLYAALQYENVEYVRQVELDVLQNWKDINSGDSALSVAGFFNSLRCCEEILKRCPSILCKTRTGTGHTALHLAAYYDRRDFIKLLLKASVTREECGDIESGITTLDNNNNKKLLPRVTSETGTALHSAVVRAYFESAKSLIEANPSNNLLRMVDANGFTALHSAVLRGFLESANLLINADRNLLGMVSKRGDTAMHIAVDFGILDIVKLLIKVDPDFEYRPNVDGHTPLFIAFQEGLTDDEPETSVAIRKLLMEKQPSQCKVPIGTNNWTILHHAAHKGDLNTIEDITKLCPECLEIVDIDNQTVLHIAVKFKQFEVVTFILDLSTVTDEILNGQDKHGNTPLHIAATGQNTRMTEFFLYNSRVRKTIVNLQGLRAIDMIYFEYDKWKAGVYGLINKIGEKEIKEQSEFDLLVGALIATVTFAAGIAVPGGYTSDGPNKGAAVLAGKTSFKVFLISNTIALLLSLYGVFSHFCLKYLREKSDVIFQLNMARCCSFGAIFAMVVTFIAGSYALLSVTEEFSIIVTVLCCCFFGLAFYTLWRIIMQGKPSVPSD